jgi:hypothetical protein
MFLAANEARPTAGKKMWVGSWWKCWLFSTWFSQVRESVPKVTLVCFTEASVLLGENKGPHRSSPTQSTSSRSFPVSKSSHLVEGSVNKYTTTHLFLVLPLDSAFVDQPPPHIQSQIQNQPSTIKFRDAGRPLLSCRPIRKARSRSYFPDELHGPYGLQGVDEAPPSCRRHGCWSLSLPLGFRSGQCEERDCRGR